MKGTYQSLFNYSNTSLCHGAVRMEEAFDVTSLPVVLVHYGESCEALLVGESFINTVKTEFKIDIDDEILVQEFEDEWQEFVDVDALEHVADRSKLRLPLGDKS
ncbi:uncharacterized protein [Montipora capricornis]|uniref:uncharacterized protein n=1 Tax=Montipora capricornis TaxID=246305 RepID=UPI0035F16699